MKLKKEIKIKNKRIEVEIEKDIFKYKTEIIRNCTIRLYTDDKLLVEAPYISPIYDYQREHNPTVEAYYQQGARYHIDNYYINAKLGEAIKKLEKEIEEEITTKEMREIEKVEEEKEEEWKKKEQKK